MRKFNSILSSINSFEQFEKFKLNVATLEQIAEEIISQHHLPNASLKLFSEGTNIVFAYGTDRVIKIFPAFHHEQFKHEFLVLKHLQGKLTVKTPIIEYHGEIANWPYLVMNKLEGTLLETLWDKLDQNNKLIIMRELGLLIREVHSLPTDGLKDIYCDWNKFINKQINQCAEHHRALKLPETLVQEIPGYLNRIKESLLQHHHPVILTGEYTPMNCLVKQVSGIWHIHALIDFGDSMLGMPEYDLLGPGAFLIQGDKQLLKEFLISYGYTQAAMTAKLSQQLTAMMLLHRYSNLNVQIRINNWQNKIRNLQDLENLVWGF